MRENILAINPGATSTKLGIFKGKRIVGEEKIEHDHQELQEFKCINDQFKPRLEHILAFMSKKYDLQTLKAVVGRGGLLRPIPSGTYIITENMLEDLRDGYAGEHACNLGGQLAWTIGKMAGVDAYIVDPVVVDEMDDMARFSGIPLIERKSIFHALNIRAMSILVAAEKGFQLDQENIIVAHMGGGFSVCAIRKGRIIDVSNGLEEGSFTTERSGSLPVLELIRLAYSGKYTYDQLKRMLVGQGGLVAYLGTNDCRKAFEMIEKGNKYAESVINAMAYQLSKEIGAMAAILDGNVKHIILTGGVAKSGYIISEIEKHVSFIAPVVVKPGEDELRALNEGVLRVLSGNEKVRIYENEVKQYSGNPACEYMKTSTC